jgi:hypothetical protein
MDYGRLVLPGIQEITESDAEDNSARDDKLLEMGAVLEIFLVEG